MPHNFPFWTAAGRLGLHPWSAAGLLVGLARSMRPFQFGEKYAALGWHPAADRQVCPTVRENA